MKKDELGILKLKIANVLKKEGVKKEGVFGSFVRGEQKRSSDIDILIQPTKGISLFGFVKLNLELEDGLGKKVDLLSYNGIRPLLRERILKEQVRIL